MYKIWCTLIICHLFWKNLYTLAPVADLKKYLWKKLFGGKQIFCLKLTHIQTAKKKIYD